MVNDPKQVPIALLEGLEMLHCVCGLSTAKADGVGPEGTLTHCHQCPVIVRICTARLHSATGMGLGLTDDLGPFPRVLFSPQFSSLPSQEFSINALPVFTQHSPLSWTCHFFDVDTAPSPSSTSFPIFCSSSSRSARQTNAAQSYFCMDRKLMASYSLGFFSPQAVKGINHLPVKQKVSALGVTQRVSDLRKCHHVGWLHTNVYSWFCLQAERCFAFSIKWLRSVMETQPVLNWQLPPALHTKLMLSYWVTSAQDLICYSQ